jgi:Ca2+-binding RTX toxin-like protein
MQGNEGADTIVGGTGNDDMIGGTGHINNDPFNTGTGSDGQPRDGRPIGADNRLDSGELDMSGGPGHDWLAGDNAVISRVLDSHGAWVPDPNGGIKRNRIWLQDVAVTGSNLATSVSGGDGMHGNGENDVMYGQGNGTTPNVLDATSDVMTGDAGDDYLEGNAGADQLQGNGQQDDMIGGTGIINNDPTTGTDGRLDAGDSLTGGDHADFQLGDNGKITRPVTGAGLWTYFTEYNPTTVRRLTARFDVAGPAGTWGDDVIDGNAGDDYQWGQDGADLMHGNDDNDDMYGELGADTLFGYSG